MIAAAAAIIEGGPAVHPRLSDEAEKVLLDLPIELEAVDGWIVDEFVKKGICTFSVDWTASAPHGQARLTEHGARYVLDLMLRLKESALCACGTKYGEHNGHPPHDNPETGCRAFTPATPVAVER